MPLSSSLKADLILVLVTLLAAAGWIFSKEALVGLPPLLFISSRFFGAGVILVLTGKTRLNSLDKAQRKSAFLSGLAFSAALCVWIFGLQYTQHLGVGAFITSLAVVLVPIVAFVLYGERPARTSWIALPIALSGLAMLTLKDGLHLDGGHLFFLVAALVFSFQFTYTSQVVRRMSPIALTAVQLLTVGVVAFLLSFMFETWPESVTPDIWWWLFASTVIATCMRFFFQIYAQSLASASHAAVIMILEPVLTTCLAAIWFGETMAATQAMGCGLIFTALMVARWRFVREMVGGLIRR
ncbi:EamA family transporter [Hahella sp. CCB-MM4]|uniref:DMT family transporter n=1 Tax=Hahella sp. (strain CCB-MM4) TaxID=1926491 RepID=UPI000B9B311D|nr:DMT family transporter [Hahella sp. CCB-MM4]OZG74724.1 EamA family transporter [Hahella sp. CCB-MM4]